MEMTDNLFSSTQKLLTPDFVNKFSSALNLPTEKIQTGLRAIIPTFLSGVVKKGSSEVGAQSLVKMAKNESVDPETIPKNLNDSSYLAKGDNALRGIFGNDVSKIAHSIGDKTGMNVKSVTTMMGMIAPMVMGVLGKKIQNESMSASGLAGFLNNQKPALTGFNMASMHGGVSGLRKSVEGINREIANERSRTSWGLILALAILFGAFYLWWNTLGNKSSTSVRQLEEAIQTESIEAAELSGLKAFLKNGDKSELPKNFAFENLKFANGTSTLMAGSIADLDKVAEALKANPNAKARIEGFTDNTGNPDLNVKLSEDRAEKVKAELVEKGIKSSRLEAHGAGQAKPVASNETEAGRAKNRRIEFVITEI